MKHVLVSAIVAGVLATASYAALSQPMGMEDGAHKGMMDPAKRDAMMAKHATELKSKLKLTADQEGAWTAFTASMKTPVPMAHPDHAEMAKLSTPERIDKMQALRTQRMAEMNANMAKRDEAVKTFYAVLTPEQKKVFDAEHLRWENRRHAGHVPSDAASADKPVRK